MFSSSKSFCCAFFFRMNWSPLQLIGNETLMEAKNLKFKTHFEHWILFGAFPFCRSHKVRSSFATYRLLLGLFEFPLVLNEDLQNSRKFASATLICFLFLFKKLFSKTSKPADIAHDTAPKNSRQPLNNHNRALQILQFTFIDPCPLQIN